MEAKDIEMLVDFFKRNIVLKEQNNQSKELLTKRIDALIYFWQVAYLKSMKKNELEKFINGEKNNYLLSLPRSKICQKTGTNGPYIPFVHNLLNNKNNLSAQTVNNSEELNERMRECANFVLEQTKNVNTEVLVENAKFLPWLDAKNEKKSYNIGTITSENIYNHYKSICMHKLFHDMQNQSDGHKEDIELLF